MLWSNHILTVLKFYRYIFQRQRLLHIYYWKKQKFLISKSVHPSWFNSNTSEFNWKTILDLDEKYTVDMQNRTNEGIKSCVQQVMTSLICELLRIEPQLKGKLIGSTSNGTNVSLNEFDYVFEIDPLCVTPALCEKWKKLISRHCLISDDMDILRHYFELSVNKIMDSLSLPESLQHGGFNSPQFTGVCTNGPAMMFQFLYKCDTSGALAALAVDFSVVIIMIPNLGIQPRHTFSDLLCVYLNHIGYSGHSWNMTRKLSGSWSKAGPSNKITLGVNEQNWLNSYAQHSPTKKVIRICKILVSLFCDYSPEMAKRTLNGPTVVRNIPAVVGVRMDSTTSVSAIECLQHIVGFRKEQKHKPVWDKRNVKYPQFRNNVSAKEMRLINTCKDIPNFTMVGELVGTEPVFHSYVFLRVVLTLMMFDEHEGRRWTDEDVPWLIITVFAIIRHQIMEKRLGESKRATILPGGPSRAPASSELEKIYLENIDDEETDTAHSCMDSFSCVSDLVDISDEFSIKQMDHVISEIHKMVTI